MIKDLYHTKKWQNKIKIWFAKTNWRPEDVEEKFPLEKSNQNNKFNPVFSQALLKFLWPQLIFIPFITLAVFFTLKNQSYLETIIFGLLLISISIIISAILSNKQYSLIYEFIRSSIVILFVSLDLISIELLASKNYFNSFCL